MTIEMLNKREDGAKMVYSEDTNIDVAILSHGTNTGITMYSLLQASQTSKKSKNNKEVSITFDAPVCMYMFVRPCNNGYAG